MKHIDFNVSILLVALASSALNLFIFCFYGKMATESFAEMAECLFESNWQSLPVRLQKYFVLMIGYAQRQMCYSGYGMVVLNLETFTQVSATFVCQILNVLQITVFKLKI